MAIPLVVNGVTYQYPQQFDKNWGPTLTNWSQAVTNGMLQKAGGSFPLTAETDFGASFGLKVLSIKSQESNIATTGYLRLGNASAGIAWRNAANSANLALTVNASNQLTFNGVSIGATTSLTDGHILVGNSSNQPADVAMSGDVTITDAGVTAIGTGKVTSSQIAAGTIVNSNISASAAISVSKLVALTPSAAVNTDGSGGLTTSSTTSTELNFVHGVTSAIQTQINTKLTKSGDTMSGVLNMGSNKITALTQGANSGEAIAFPVGTAQISAGAITTALLASGAVTQVQSSGNLTGSDGSTTITTKSITTTGGKVLIFAQAVIGGTSNGSGEISFGTSVTRGGTGLTGASTTCILWGVATRSFTVPTFIVTVDSPVAGTYTYNFTYQPTLLISPSLGDYSLVVVELKA